MKIIKKQVTFAVLLYCALARGAEQTSASAVGQPAAEAPRKALPLPGEVFLVRGRTAFVILPQMKSADRAVPWVWYAPTLPGLPGEEEKWMFERFGKAGMAVAGIDVGESYGSPAGRALYSAFYDELTGHRGFAPKAVMLGRSRGGLMNLAWAVENADKVAGFAGIYPVCNVASYPGVAQASAAYGLTPEEFSARLAEHNPIDRLDGLAKAGVPLFAIHGDNDTVVPLEANSGEMRRRYETLGGNMRLIIPPGQGHNMWAGFFQCQELVDFALARGAGVNGSRNLPVVQTKPAPTALAQMAAGEARRDVELHTGAPPANAPVSIKAFCIDFNWGEGGPNGFAKPGLWADASPQRHVEWYAALGCNVIQTFAVSCNGYAWYRGGPVPPQPGLKHDFLTETVKLGHDQGLKVMGYFCVGANSLWGQTRTNLSYGAPSAPHIPFTQEYLDYLTASIEDALRRTGMDGFMIDWVWNPGDLDGGRLQWLACEQQMYRELLGGVFPGKDQISPERELEFRRRAIDRCWERIRAAAKRTKPDCVIWLSCCNLSAPVVVNSKLFREVDWLMNEATDAKTLDPVEAMKGEHTRLVQCVVGWGDAHDARRLLSSGAERHLGIYGFAKPGPDSLPLPVAEHRSRGIATFKGNDRNIAVLARAFNGAPIEIP